MPFASLRIPPGVRRNGTKYQSKGRWFVANLVRWSEGAMQAVGGWEKVERNEFLDVSACISDDGGVFTDETADANSAGADDVILIPASPQVDDALYVAFALPFDGIVVDVTTVATDGAVTWEYYNGSAWVALSNVDDPTNGFTPAAPTIKNVTWDMPTDWEETTVNSQGPFYYVRARVTTAGTTTALGGGIDLNYGQVNVADPVRGLLGWRSNADAAHLALGTADKAYALVAGVLTDITPASGFTGGGVDAVFSVGNYGDGIYGNGPYGTGLESQGTITEANTWQFDTFGQELVALAHSDGDIMEWDLNTANNLVTIANAPVNNLGVVVTPERFVVALGSAGVARQVSWSDQEDSSVWAPAATNQAGDFILPGQGSIQSGARLRAETLIWTDVDVFTMRYIGGTLVYSFAAVGHNCGIIGRRAKAVVDGRAFWMSHRGFFVYDGFTRPIPCEISDDIFNDINRVQRSKIAAWSVNEYNEIWFSYPSAASTENDKVIVYNYEENHWSGPWDLERTSGIDRSAFGVPVMTDANGGAYFHETGDVHLAPNDATVLVPTAESGPMEIGEGDRVMTVRQFIPDENTLGDVDVTVFAGFYPTETESSQVVTVEAPTDVRLTGRQVRVKLSQDQPGWRWGVPRLEVIPRGER